MSSFLDEPVRGFLDQLAARTPTPGGGGAAAVTGAMAAGLVAMAARFSATQLPGDENLDELLLISTFLRRPPPELRVAPLEADEILKLAAALPRSLAQPAGRRAPARARAA